jgi:hypothetical protein
MKIKKLAATATMAGALGFTAFGLAAGSAQADPGWRCPLPPGVQGPGPGCVAPPGQLNQFFGPPGHWWVNPGAVNHW